MYIRACVVCVSVDLFRWHHVWMCAWTDRSMATSPFFFPLPVMQPLIPKKTKQSQTIPQVDPPPVRMPAPLEALLLAMRAQETSETDETGGAACAGEEEGGVVAGGGASSCAMVGLLGPSDRLCGGGERMWAGFDSLHNLSDPDPNGMKSIQEDSSHISPRQSCRSWRRGPTASSWRRVGACACGSGTCYV